MGRLCDINPAHREALMPLGTAPHRTQAQAVALGAPPSTHPGRQPPWAGDRGGRRHTRRPAIARGPRLTAGQWLADACVRPHSQAARARAAAGWIREASSPAGRVRHAVPVAVACRPERRTLHQAAALTALADGADAPCWEPPGCVGGTYRGAARAPTAADTFTLRAAGARGRARTHADTQAPAPPMRQGCARGAHWVRAWRRARRPNSPGGPWGVLLAAP